MDYDPSETVTCSLKHILELELENVGSIEIRQDIPDTVVIYLLTDCLSNGSTSNTSKKQSTHFRNAKEQ
uniref:Uncharacterized protein n=1 Tax=Caenorhabditis tropicalis TaxID=1561998 RepID=A0A1I7U1Q4_9PELO